MKEEVIYGQLKLRVGGGRCKERLELVDKSWSRRMLRKVELKLV